MTALIISAIAETSEFTATFDDNETKKGDIGHKTTPAVVTFVAGPVSLVTSRIKATDRIGKTDGSDTGTLQVTLLDRYSTPKKDVFVQFEADSGADTITFG